MSDAFRVTPYQVKAEGKDVPPNEIQAAINSLANQTTFELNQIGNGAGPIFAAIMLAWFQSLPTSPGASGTFWNDGNTLAYVP
ncbi:hypothetical protein [Burkholderia sp. Bp8994]|uniref:hypothetical protein n=1 Tax=Burkholderia sp. Bp8994 TaxID=2184555 RepID=UPI000F592811|nr:hypothetical protein [Burkholderia sp. Bp8994]